MLTQKQLNALVWINQYIRRHGIAPSYEEIQDGLGVGSKSTVSQLVKALEERSYIRRLENKARAIEIIRIPSVLETGRNGEFSQNNESNTEFGSTDEYQEHPECVVLKLMGRIAAGSPIEAIQDTTETIAVPLSVVSGFGEHFALKVSGDSMIEAGIMDGDIAIVRSQVSADYGDIVVAFIMGETATLKRIRRHRYGVLLEAANTSIIDQVYSKEDVEIQGKLVGLYRSYG